MKQEAIVANREKLEEAKKRMMGDGKDNFLVVADFNKTFTQAGNNWAELTVELPDV